VQFDSTCVRPARGTETPRRAVWRESPVARRCGDCVKKGVNSTLPSLKCQLHKAKELKDFSRLLQIGYALNFVILFGRFSFPVVEWLI